MTPELFRINKVPKYELLTKLVTSKLLTILLTEVMTEQLAKLQTEIAFEQLTNC